MVVATCSGCARWAAGGDRQHVVAFLCQVDGAARRISKMKLLDQVGGHAWCATDGLFPGADAVVCLLALGPDQMTDNDRQCLVPSDRGTTVSSGAVGRGAERVAASTLPQATSLCRIVGSACFVAGGPADSDCEEGHA